MIAVKFTNFIIFFLSCQAQLGVSFCSVLANVLVQNPIVQVATQTSGEVIANAVDTISEVPIAISQIVGSEYTFPALQNHKNIVDVTDKLLPEFYSQIDNEDVRLSIDKLVIKYGYPIEMHDVITEDGYVLRMHRIPRNGSVVFLMHGLVGSADDFVTNGPESGLAYLLADEGYDVWMGNARGNKHSRNHEYFTPADSEFWDFSWHEIGYYDLPTMIDHALATSTSDTLKYIGYSQGTTVFFVMAAERAEYHQKVSFMIALSPVAYMTNAKSPLVRLLSPEGPFVYNLVKTLGIYEAFPDNTLVKLLKRLTCGIGTLAEILCNNLLFLIVGYDWEQLNITNLPVMLGHLPSGSSAKQLAHYGQGVVSGEFRQYDCGMKGNLMRYGLCTPPKYSLNRIKVPVSLFYSDSDWLAHPTDVDRLHNELPNVVDIHKIPGFNHLDYIFAKDFKKLIYERLRKLLLSF